MIAGIVVARVAGPDVVGTIGYATAYISIFAFLPGIFSTGHIKAISEGKSLADCFSTFKILQVFSIFVFALLVIIYIIYDYFYGTGFKNNDANFIFILFLILSANLFDCFNNFTSSTNAALLFQAKANLPNLLYSFIYQIGRIVVVLLGLRALGLAFINLIAAVLVIPLGIRLFKEIPKGKFDPDLARYYWYITKPILLFFMINSIVANIDRIFLVKYTSVSELGFYTAAFSIGGLFLLVSNTVGLIFFPLFSRLITENKFLELESKLKLYTSFIGVFVFPVLLSFVLFGKDLLVFLLGAKYEPSGLPFIIILFATYFEILGMPYGNVISGMGKFYSLVVINCIKLVLFFVGLVTFVSPYGFNLGASGVALNLLWVHIVINLIFYLYSKIIINFSFNLKSLFIHLSSLFSFIVCLLLNKSFLGINVFIVFVLQILMSYFLLYTFKLVSKTDLLIMYELLNVNKLISYLKSELKS